MRTINQIVIDKRAGIDCDADESALIKAYFDSHVVDQTSRNAGDPIATELAERFPLEWSEWNTEGRADPVVGQTVYAAWAVRTANAGGSGWANPWLAPRENFRAYVVDEISTIGSFGLRASDRSPRIWCYRADEFLTQAQFDARFPDTSES